MLCVCNCTFSWPSPPRPLFPSSSPWALCAWRGCASLFWGQNRDLTFFHLFLLQSQPSLAWLWLWQERNWGVGGGPPAGAVGLCPPPRHGCVVAAAPRLGHGDIPKLGSLHQAQLQPRAPLWDNPWCRGSLLGGVPGAVQAAPPPAAWAVEVPVRFPRPRAWPSWHGPSAELMLGMSSRWLRDRRVQRAARGGSSAGTAGGGAAPRMGVRWGGPHGGWLLAVSLRWGSGATLWGEGLGARWHRWCTQPLMWPRCWVGGAAAPSRFWGGRLSPWPAQAVQDNVTRVCTQKCLIIKLPPPPRSLCAGAGLPFPAERSVHSHGVGGTGWGHAGSTQQLRVKPDGAVGARGEDPRLGGVEEHIEDAQVQGQRVALQHLDGHQQRVLQQVAVGGEGSARGSASPPPPHPGVPPGVTPQMLHAPSPSPNPRRGAAQHPLPCSPVLPRGCGRTGDPKADPKAPGPPHALVDHAVAHDDRPVVRARGEERVVLVEGHAPQSFLVVPAERGCRQGEGGGAGCSPVHGQASQTLPPELLPQTHGRNEGGLGQPRAQHPGVQAGYRGTPTCAQPPVGLGLTAAAGRAWWRGPGRTRPACCRSCRR